MKLKFSNLSMVEMIGAAAVVLSLIFVGVEIRDGNREARAATIQSTLNTNLEMSTVLAEHAGTWDKLMTGEPLASGEELRRGIVLFNMLMTESENRFLQFESGYLDVQSWEGRRSVLGRLVSLPIFETWRHSAGGLSHSADFLEVLDELANNTHE